MSNLTSMALGKLSLTKAKLHILFGQYHELKDSTLNILLNDIPEAQYNQIIWAKLMFPSSNDLTIKERISYKNCSFTNAG